MKELIEIQSELKAPKSQYNAFGKYKYRNCEDILEALKPLLLKNGCTLSITDDIVLVGSRIYVSATVYIKKGDVMETSTGFAREPESQKGMNEAQITGSASSYARKYALNGLFLIDDTKDADATNDHGKTKPQPKAPAVAPAPTPAKTKTELKPENAEKWEKAIAFLVSGKLISEVEASFTLSKVNKQLLMDSALNN